MKSIERVGRHLLIRGIVQGVGFRWFLSLEAKRRGVAGWVRNIRDGRVEAQIYGSPAAVAAVIHWATMGPPGARVDEVTVEERTEVLHGFERRATIHTIENCNRGEV